jgi:hypothetical protein
MNSYQFETELKRSKVVPVLKHYVMKTYGGVDV